jgi:NTE family protein
VVGAQRSERLRDIFKSRTLIGAQGAYYYNTMFGPMGAALGYSNYAKSLYFLINLGYVF